MSPPLANLTADPWRFDPADFTLRSHSWGRSDLMGDYRGVVVCDFKPAVGITDPGNIATGTFRGHCLPELRDNVRLIEAAPVLYRCVLDSHRIMCELATRLREGGHRDAADQVVIVMDALSAAAFSAVEPSTTEQAFGLLAHVYRRGGAA